MSPSKELPVSREEALDVIDLCSPIAQALLGVALIPPESFTGVPMLRYHIADTLTRTPSPLELEKAHKKLAILTNLASYASRIHTSLEENETDTDLRTQKQSEMFLDIYQAYEEGGDKLGIKAPTGVGKTNLFLLALEGATDSSSELRSLVLVPRIGLVEQTYARIDSVGFKLDAGRVYSAKKEHGREVTIMTYQTMQAMTERGEISPDSYDLLILDEAHLAIGEKTKAAIKSLTPSLILGVTATHEYNKNRTVQKALGMEMVHEMYVREAIELGLLADCRVVLGKTSYDLSSVTIKNTGEYDEKELQVAIDTTARNMAGAQLYQSLCEKVNDDGSISRTPAIMYSAGVAHAVHMSEILRELGVNAQAIWGKMKPQEQKAILDAYERGEIDVLVNDALLGTGTDLPRTKAVFFLAPKFSSVTVEQYAGRALRLTDTGEEALIVHILDQDNRAKGRQVLFSEILQGASARGPNAPTIRSRTAKEFRSKVLPEIEGLEVIVDEQEVERVTRENQEKREEEIFKIPDGYILATPESLGLSEDETRWRYKGKFQIGKIMQSIRISLDAKDKKNGSHELDEFNERIYSKTGKDGIYLHPEVLKILREYIAQKTLQIPDGYLLIALESLGLSKDETRWKKNGKFSPGNIIKSIRISLGLKDKKNGSHELDEFNRGVIMNENKGGYLSPEALETAKEYIVQNTLELTDRYILATPESLGLSKDETRWRQKDKFSPGKMIQSIRISLDAKDKKNGTHELDEFNRGVITKGGFGSCFSPKALEMAKEYIRSTSH